MAHAVQARSDAFVERYLRQGSRLCKMMSEVAGEPNFTVMYVRRLDGGPHWRAVHDHYVQGKRERAQWQDAADREWALRARLAASMFIALGRGMDQGNESLGPAMDAVRKGTNAALARLGKRGGVFSPGQACIKTAGTDGASIRAALLGLGEEVMRAQGAEPDAAYINEVIDAFFGNVLEGLAQTGPKGHMQDAIGTKMPVHMLPGLVALSNSLQDEYWVEAVHAERLAERLMVLYAKVLVLELISERLLALPKYLEILGKAPNKGQRADILKALHTAGIIHAEASHASLHGAVPGVTLSLEGLQAELAWLMSKEMGSTDHHANPEDRGDVSSYLLHEQRFAEKSPYGLLASYLEKAVVELSGDTAVAMHEVIQKKDAYTDEDLARMHDELVARLSGSRAAADGLILATLAEWQSVWEEVSAHAAKGYRHLDRIGARSEESMPDQGGVVRQLPVDVRFKKITEDARIGSYPTVGQMARDALRASPEPVPAAEPQEDFSGIRP